MLSSLPPYQSRDKSWGCRQATCPSPSLPSPDSGSVPCRHIVNNLCLPSPNFTREYFSFLLWRTFSFLPPSLATGGWLRTSRISHFFLAGICFGSLNLLALKWARGSTPVIPVIKRIQGMRIASVLASLCYSQREEKQTIQGLGTPKSHSQLFQL